MLEILNILLASSLTGLICYRRGKKKGEIAGEFNTLRDAAIAAAMARHPAGGSQRHLHSVPPSA